MYDGLRNFFFESVLADHDAYRKERDIKIAGLSNDLRLATHACSSMFHLADHIFDEFRNSQNFSFQSLKNYQTHLVNGCSDFGIVRDCANVHKHRQLTRHAPLVSSAESLQEVVIITEYKDDKGPYRIAEKEIHINLNDGTTRILHECLDSVRRMWWSELIGLAVFPAPSSSPENAEPSPPLREQDGERARLDIQIRQGERFKQNMILKRFNYESMKVEPLDITGCEMSGGIYRQNYVAEFNLENSATGETLTRSVELTEEEHQSLLQLQSESEYQALLGQIAHRKGVLGEMLQEIGQHNR
jgi:hypothetical protein